MNDFDEKYVRAMLALHNDVMRLDSQDDDETRIWHMMRSLLEYCRAHKLNLQSIIDNADEDMATS